MRSRITRVLAVATSAAALATGVAVSSASAQQQGLVNVEISNVLNNNTFQVTVPINAAANVCGVTVAVLTQNLQNGPVTCEAGANQQFRILGFV
jgi:hypothetical protein